MTVFTESDNRESNWPGLSAESCCCSTPEHPLREALGRHGSVSMVWLEI